MWALAACLNITLSVSLYVQSTSSTSWRWKQAYDPCSMFEHYFTCISLCSKYIQHLLEMKTALWPLQHVWTLLYLHLFMFKVHPAPLGDENSFLTLATCLNITLPVSLYVQSTSSTSWRWKQTYDPSLFLKIAPSYHPCSLIMIVFTFSSKDYY